MEWVCNGRSVGIVRLRTKGHGVGMEWDSFSLVGITDDLLK
jgi:hypothetical protein